MTPTMFTEGNIETAMCLWEEVLAHDDDPRVVQAREREGTVALRHIIIGLIPACEELWDWLYQRDLPDQLDLVPYDWAFCPKFLWDYCDWSFGHPFVNKAAIARFKQAHVR